MLDLETFQESDIEQLIEWIPDGRFLLQWAGPGYRFPLTQEQLLATLEEARRSPPNRFVFRVRLDKNTTIGHVQLVVMDYSKKTGHICRVLVGSPENRGKGLGSELMHLILRYGFETLQLESLTLSVFTFNQSAVACYERLGFKEVDPRPKAFPYESELWDSVKMRLQRTEWEGRQRNPAH